MKTIKLNKDPDYIMLVVINEKKEQRIVRRFRVSGMTDKKASKVFEAAKAAAFDEVWRYKELGAQVELDPYMNPPDSKL